jgi:hypothetical protein
MEIIRINGQQRNDDPEADEVNEDRQENDKYGGFFHGQEIKSIVRTIS